MNVFINSIFGGIQLNYTHFFLKKKKAINYAISYRRTLKIVDYPLQSAYLPISLDFEKLIDL